MDKLRETQEAYQETNARLSQLEADNGVLMRQLQALLPQEEVRVPLLLFSYHVIVCIGSRKTSRNVRRSQESWNTYKWTY